MIQRFLLPQNAVMAAQLESDVDSENLKEKSEKNRKESKRENTKQKAWNCY
jgi:hypothetical protein